MDKKTNRAARDLSRASKSIRKESAGGARTVIKWCKDIERVVDKATERIDLSGKQSDDTREGETSGRSSVVHREDCEGACWLESRRRSTAFKI